MSHLQVPPSRLHAGWWTGDVIYKAALQKQKIKASPTCSAYCMAFPDWHVGVYAYASHSVSNPR